MKDEAGTHNSRFYESTMSNNVFRMFPLVLVLATVCLATPVAAQSSGAPESETQFRKLMDSIFPAAGEEKWRQTPWVPSISTGRRMAQERKRPMFLWAMNGDPLGCV